MAEEVLQVIRNRPARGVAFAYRGCTWLSDVYRFTDDEDNPIDISNFEFEMEVRYSEYQNTGEPLIKATQFILTQSAAAQAANIPKDEMHIEIPPEKTNVRSGTWDADVIYREYAGGPRLPLEKLRFIIQEDTTPLST